MYNIVELNQNEMSVVTGGKIGPSIFSIGAAIVIPSFVISNVLRKIKLNTSIYDPVTKKSVNSLCNYYCLTSDGILFAVAAIVGFSKACDYISNKFWPAKNET